MPVTGYPLSAGTSTVGINAQTGTTYTLVASDAGKIVTCSNAGVVQVTIPPSSSVAFQVGTKIEIAQFGAGLVVVLPGSGVTLTPGTARPSTRYGTLTLINTGTDAWTALNATVGNLFSNTANMTLVGSPVPTGFYKSGGSSAFDGEVRSTYGYANTCQFSCVLTSGNNIAVGLDANPTVDVGYAAIDYCCYYQSGNLYIYENGAGGSVYGYPSLGSTLSVAYDGTNVVYKLNGSTIKSIARAGGVPLYFDSSFYDVGARVDSFTFSGT